MITALTETHRSYLKVVYKFQDLKEQELRLPGTDEEKLMNEVNRLLYFEIRKYILARMKGWLKQRLYAFQLNDRAIFSQDAAKLFVMLGYYENGSCFTICKLIADNRKTLEALAPGERSKHYSRFINTIVPIISFCEEQSKRF